MNFFTRMYKAAAFDVDTYEEVEADKTATVQAFVVILLANISAGIGNLHDYSVLLSTEALLINVKTILAHIAIAIIGWVIWALVTLFVGTQLMAESTTKSNMGELLRTIGFASSPGILYFLGLVPGIGVYLEFLIILWLLGTMVIAVRQALDFKSTLRAIGVCVVGWITYGLVIFFAGTLILIVTALINN